MNIEQLFTRKENTEIDEARMTPSEFEKGIATGAQAGVLVGFEFETCMPKATMEGQTQQSNDPDEWMKQVSVQDMVKRLGASRVFTDLAQKRRRVEYKNNTYNSLKSAYYGYVEKPLRKKLGELYSEMPENVKEEWEQQKAAATELATSVGFIFSDNPTLAELRALRGYAAYNWRMPRSFRQKVDNAYRKFYNTDYVAGQKFITKFLLDVYGPAENMYELLHGRNLKVAADHDVTYARPYVGHNRNSTYTKTSEVLKPVLEQAFGKVQVFNRYHEGTKKLDTWYIEPDGSLRPKDGDGSAEIVSPPLLADTAMRDLAKFYGIAKQLNLYTNDSTGLHINVSIPKDIDVLKLAVFTGDQYVLKRFGRADNYYARSILGRLRGDVRKKDFSNQGENEIYGQTAEEKIEDIRMVARRISSDHFSSVNYNGKYVSFRHAGGDYLSDYRGIVETVGRFVLAIQIAADPDAYKAEYIKKLVAMFGEEEQKDTERDPMEVFKIIRGTGIPTIQLAMFWRFDVPMTPDLENSMKARLANWLGIDRDAFAVQIMQGKDAQAQHFLQSNQGGLGSVTVEKIAQADPTSFFMASISPINYQVIDRFLYGVEKVRSGSAERDAVGITGQVEGEWERVIIGKPASATVIQAGTPEFSMLARPILKGISRAQSKKPNLPESR